MFCQQAHDIRYWSLRPSAGSFWSHFSEDVQLRIYLVHKNVRLCLTFHFKTFHCRTIFYCQRRWKKIWRFKLNLFLWNFTFDCDDEELENKIFPFSDGNKFSPCWMMRRSERLFGSGNSSQWERSDAANVCKETRDVIALVSVTEYHFHLCGNHRKILFFLSLYAVRQHEYLKDLVTCYDTIYYVTSIRHPSFRPLLPLALRAKIFRMRKCRRFFPFPTPPDRQQEQKEKENSYKRDKKKVEKSETTREKRSMQK